ncbi:unnamed protein product, partial [Nesidiocoris tenuis]
MENHREEPAVRGQTDANAVYLLVNIMSTAYLVCDSAVHLCVRLQSVSFIVTNFGTETTKNVKKHNRPRIVILVEMINCSIHPVHHCICESKFTFIRRRASHPGRESGAGQGEKIGTRDEKQRETREKYSKNSKPTASPSKLSFCVFSKIYPNNYYAKLDIVQWTTSPFPIGLPGQYAPSWSKPQHLGLVSSNLDRTADPILMKLVLEVADRSRQELDPPAHTDKHTHEPPRTQCRSYGTRSDTDLLPNYPRPARLSVPSIRPTGLPPLLPFSRCLVCGSYFLNYLPKFDRCLIARIDSDTIPTIIALHHKAPAVARPWRPKLLRCSALSLPPLAAPMSTELSEPAELLLCHSLGAGGHFFGTEPRIIGRADRIPTVSGRFPSRALTRISVDHTRYFHSLFNNLLNIFCFGTHQNMSAHLGPFIQKCPILK